MSLFQASQQWSRRRSQSDRDDCEALAKQVWNCSLRDGNAFLRLAWRLTQHVLDVLEVWRAVCAIKGALFSGLIHVEPADPRPGDKAEFVLDGEAAEALIAAAGVTQGMLWREHKCGPGRVSKRFSQLVEEWVA